MARPAGLGMLILTDPLFNGEVHTETFTCQHCSIIRPLSESGAVCKKCMGYICRRPACHQNCSPIKAKLY